MYGHKLNIYLTHRMCQNTEPNLRVHYHVYITLCTSSCVCYYVYVTLCTILCVRHPVYVTLCTFHWVHHTVYIITCTLLYVDYNLYKMQLTNWIHALKRALAIKSRGVRVLWNLLTSKNELKINTGKIQISNEPFRSNPRVWTVQQFFCSWSYLLC